MIPKTIFTIWLSEKREMPETVQKCIPTHKIEGYQWKLITLANCYHCKYVDDAIKAKQWGKACDYLRIWYLIDEGGIYLDADVAMLPNKNFDGLLNNPIFAAYENNKFINTAVIGAEKDNQTLKDHLRRVERSFKGDDGLYFESSIEIFTPRMYKSGGLILPPEYFYPYDHQAGTVNITKNTICYHFFLKSWL
jgi:mannosyltransferase OCH1-like enzyme